MKFLSLIFIIVSFAISSPSFAQSKDEEFPVEAQQTENTGPYVRETHGAWEVRCVKLADNETCTLYQLLKDKNDISVAEINVEVLPLGNQASAGITLITPLGTSLAAQLGWHIDDVFALTALTILSTSDKVLLFFRPDATNTLA